jgi:FMN phosphatase YigB (HAD superfamily)
MQTTRSEIDESAQARHPFGGVVFDADNVLYPRRQYTLGGYRAVADYLFATYGARLYEAMADHADEGDGLPGLERAVKDCFTGHLDALLIRCRHVFWTHAPRLTLYPDAALALAYLRNRRVRLAVIDRNRPHAHAAMTAALGLHAWLDCVLCAGPPEYADSIAGSLMLAELALETPLTRMVYVGAAERSDFRTADRLGMTTVRVERRESRAVPDADPPPRIVLPSLAALPGALLDYAMQDGILE